MISANFLYTSVKKDYQRRLDAIGKDPVIARETKYYQENITKIKTVDDFMKNDRVYNYALKAFGLEEMIYAKGMIRKVLTDSKFAERLLDKRYAEFRKAFDFDTYGEKTTSRKEVCSDPINKMKEIDLEETLGEQNAGARLAVYFERRVQELVNNKEIPLEDDGKNDDIWVYKLLGDAALSKTVFTALGFSDKVQSADMEAKKRLIETRMKKEDVIDPARREKFIKRFLAMYDFKNTKTFSPALTILQSSMPKQGGMFSTQSMIAMQNLRLGGR